ncbi:MAG TPA: response regulator [Pyrinomonadaceae bacterium]|nr:response regulator [Pyrinomonadaceae bacterium]
MLSNTNQSSRRILVAEDDPEMMLVVKRILVEAGYRVVVANDGREAYRILQSDADFRAAIFDMKLPHLQGIDIIRYMRTEKRLMRIPVVMMTADRALNVPGESFAAGASAFLLKPFTAQNVQTILRLIEHSEGVAA